MGRGARATGRICLSSRLDAPLGSTCRHGTLLRPAADVAVIQLTPCLAVVRGPVLRRGDPGAAELLSVDRVVLRAAGSERRLFGILDSPLTGELDEDLSSASSMRPGRATPS